MQLRLKKWGNGTGIRFTKEFLRRAGISLNDTLDAEIINGQIVLTPQFRHRSLKERAAAYGQRDGVGFRDRRFVAVLFNVRTRRRSRYEY